ncbi:MAG TPA: LacI family transcriptional regulator [Firmicutes bacterium]|nr:LacI family transcriptional regulator [Bacillota bacterium]
MNIKEVACLAGVSPATVSRVLNGSKNVRKSTRRKVLQAIEESGYRPNQVARGLRLRRFQSIGLVVPDITNEFFATIARSIEDVLHEHNYNLFLCNTREDGEEERRYIKALLDKFVDGIIFVSGGFEENLDLFQGDIPVVAIDRRSNLEGVSFVTSANYEGGYLAAKHLIECGCRRILMVRDQKQVAPMEARWAGYVDCLKDYNIPYDEGLVVSIPVEREAAREYLLRMHSQLEFDGIFAATDVLAIACAHTLLRLGYSIPKDVQIVGFDNITAAEYYNPSLTTIAQEKEALGRKGAELLLERIEDPEKEPATVVLPVQLIQRASTRQY